MISIYKLGLVGIFAALVALPALASASPVIAVESGLQSETSKVEQSQDTLAAVKDDTTLSPEERAEKEISARREIVINALTLSLAEVESIKAGLAKLPQFGEESREKELKEQFLIELDVFNKYYSDKLEQVKSVLKPTLEEIKAAAQEIIDYRETTYNVAIKKAIDFTLFFYNSEVIATANIRLEKIASDISRLEKLNLLRAGLFKVSLEKIGLLLSEAAALQRQASELILGTSTGEVNIEGVPAETTIEPTPAPDANALIKESLSKIRSAYEVFLQISKDIRTSLGIK